MALTGKNISLPIYYNNSNGVRTPFHDLVLHKFTVDSVVMSLGDKITGDVYYNDKNLVCTMKEYVVFNDVEYSLVNPPTLVKEGLVKDNSDLKGMSKYSFEFYHPMYILGNMPFTDVAVSYDELRYKSQDKTFAWIGKPADFVAKLNKNLEQTEWLVVMSDNFPQDKEDELSGVLTFDNNTIADVLKLGYDTWGVPYVVDKIHDGEYTDEDFYTQDKRFVVVFGLPSNEIYESDSARQNGTPFVFRFGQGVGLKNHSRTPRNNKIVTRIAGYGSERNIPYGYPQIRWYGDPNATCTIGNSVGAKQNQTINGVTYDWVMSYPIYDGIVGGEWVKLIKHPFTRKHLMPTVYAEGVFNKVSQFLPNGNANPDFNPDLEIVDYYDAVEDDEEFPYENNINIAAPSYEIKEFEDIYPELGSYEILGATPINADMTDADGWDDSMDDNGNYLQSYFKIQLPQLDFDIYACAAITEEMEINMRSGACIGCTFTVQVDWDDYKRNFYDSDMNFAPHGSQRDFSKYPDSSEGGITVVVQKDINTFGTLMPNIYQNPAAGDAFVVLGISLPLSYITNAQNRLDDAMKSYMLENNIHYFDYPLKFDEHFLANHTYVLNQIRPNSVIRFEFNNKTLALYVKQLTIKFNEAPLPQYDITLTDNVEIVLNSIGQVAEDIEHLGTLIALLRQSYNKNVWAELSKKLSRVSDDTANGLISFAQGWQTSGFFSNNFLGYGASVNQRGVGEFEEVNVRGALRASELVFNQIRAEGGERIESIGYGEIETVEIGMSLGTPLSGTATLKLDGDEWATVDVGDICRGVYNTLGDTDLYNDSVANEGEDDNGFKNRKGFFSSYFVITRIISNQKGYCKFNYKIQVEGKTPEQNLSNNDVPTCEHPCPLMKFAVYGNCHKNNNAQYDKLERQSFIYTTAVGISPRKMFVSGVHDWKIKPENIKLASGNIEGITAWEIVDASEYDDDGSGYWKIETRDGETVYMHLKTLHGNAGFYCEDNIYLGGIIDQFKNAAMDIINSQVSNLGQSYVWTDASSFIVDCTDAGTVVEDSPISFNAKLYYGNQICNITEAKVNNVAIPSSSFTENGTNVPYSITIAKDTENFQSYVIQVNLKGTYNNTEYTAMKSITVFANKQGSQGQSGGGVAWVDVVPSAITIDCNPDGTLVNQNYYTISAALYVGNSIVDQSTLTIKNAVYSDNSHYEPVVTELTPSGNVLSWLFEFFDDLTDIRQSTIDITLSNGTYTANKSIPVIPIRRGAQGESLGGYSAQLTHNADNIVVDAQGIVIGGLTNRLFTEVKIWDSANNRQLTYQNTSNTPSNGNFKLAIVPSNCSASVDTSNGRVNISGINNPTISNYCSVTITATTYDGVVFSFVYGVTLTHIDLSYLAFDLNNEYDSMAYRTQTKRYDGLPLSATLNVYANGVRNTDGGVTYNNVRIFDTPSVGYIKKTTATSDLFEGSVSIIPLLTTNNATGEITSVVHRNSANKTIYDSNDQDTGLRFQVNSGGTVTLKHLNNASNELDLDDAKHWVDIVVEVVYGGATYISPTKHFTISETTDSTIYRLMLSATAISQEESVYTPASIEVNASVTDENGTTVYTPDSENGKVLGNIYVKYINGAYNPNGSNTLLDTCPLFANVTKVFTVVLVDLSNANSPVYLDIQTVTINKGGKDGAGQSWINSSHDQFVVDCKADGTVETRKQLDLTANLRWGDENCKITSATIVPTGLTNVTEYTLSGLNTTQVSKRFVFVAGNKLTSGYITITLSGTSTGSTDVHSATKTVAIIAQRKGDSIEGEEGRGIVSSITYYKAFQTSDNVTPPETDVDDPTSQGWSATYIDATEENPYLWRFTRTTYTKEPTIEQTNAELIYVWSDTANPNLLADTDLISGQLSAWNVIGDALGETDASFNIVTNAYQGHNSYHAIKSYSDDDPIILLDQIVYKRGILERIEPNKWYTLSFYAESGHYENSFINVVVPAVDTSGGDLMYVDGVATNAKAIVTFDNFDGNWHRHTITFKTTGTFLENQVYTCQWNMTSDVVQESEIEISMPKLEVGMVATQYKPMMSVIEPIARASTWVEGKQYFQGAFGEPFIDVVNYGNKWYRCIRSHISSIDNVPQEGVSSLYWQQASNFNFIATDLLLADQAVIRLMFSQKILTTNENNQLTASINADGLGSYCIYYPESGNKKFEFSQTRDIVCYNNNDNNSIAWVLGASGIIIRSSEPSWHKIWLNLRSLNREPSNNSFNGNDTFIRTAYPEYISGDNGVQSENGKIYKADHDYSQGANGNYITNGWYTNYEKPTLAFSTDDTEIWEIEVMHIVSGVITQRKIITTNIAGT